MARKASKPETDPETPDGDEPSDTVRDGRSASGIITKAEAIRQAISEGYASPDAGTDYIRSTFGLEVSKPHFSATKSTLKKNGGGKASGLTIKVKRGRKPRGADGPAVGGYVAPPRPAASNGEGELLAALEAMKPLVASMGADRVKRLVDLLG